ncbi:MAG TPA: S41 family peptidase [Bacteroidales bacterium]|nr:S41 family peptidase [Bacteroidales bacterium]
MEHKRIYILLPLIIGVAMFCGFYIARFTGMSANNSADSKDKLTALMELLETEYVDSVSRNEIIESIIPFVLEKLDPHSSYIVPEDYNEIQDPIRGSFEGIGVQFNVKNDTIVIMQIISGGPSEKVNIKAGDRIVTINDSVVAGIGITNDNVVKLLKGPKGTKVKVGIRRGKQTKLLDFVITRDKIPFNSIDAAYMIEPKTGYIKISRFAATTPEEYSEHITKLRSQGMTRIIIDLRENGGGVLGSAIFLANEFLHKKDVIVYTQGKAHAPQYYHADGKGTCQDLAVAVLINEYSASASEIFAGAIQDNDRGIIVGRRSFGKGLVNRDFMFADSSMVRLTIQKFYSPSGRCIQKPYSDKKSDYANELIERYAHGEMQIKDSIHFPDSLIYKTKGGKTVYGGGGIMPEFFVPIDTSGYSELYSDLIQQSIIYDFAFEWSDSHRAKLSTYKQLSQFESYVKTQQLWNSLLTYAYSKDIQASRTDILVSKHRIESQLYAYIARNIFGESEFYMIINRDDSTIRKALQELNK